MPCEPAGTWKDGRLLRRCLEAAPFPCFPVCPGRLSWGRSCLVWAWHWLNGIWITFSSGLLYVSKLGSWPPVSLLNSFLHHPYYCHSDLTKHSSVPPCCHQGTQGFHNRSLAHFTCPTTVSLSSMLTHYGHTDGAMLDYLHILRKTMCSWYFCLWCCLYMEQPSLPSSVASYSLFKTSSGAPPYRKALLIFLL